VLQRYFANFFSRRGVLQPFAVVEVNIVLYCTMPMSFHRTKNNKKPPQQGRKITLISQRAYCSFQAGTTKTRFPVFGPPEHQHKS